MQTREQHIGKMEQRFEQWGNRFDGLTAEAGLVGDEAKTGYREHLDDLQSKHQLVRAKFDQLKAASGDEWKRLESGVEGAWKDLETSFVKLSGSTPGR